MRRTASRAAWWACYLLTPACAAHAANAKPQAAHAPTASTHDGSAADAGEPRPFAVCGRSRCDFDLTTPPGEDEARARLVRRPCRGDQTCASASGRLTAAGRSALHAVRDRLLATADLAPVYGCPGCVDGGTYAFSLPAAGGRAVEHEYDTLLLDRLAEAGPDGEPPVYEGPRVPNALIDAHEVFQTLVEGVAWCRSNDLIAVVEPCIPTER